MAHRILLVDDEPDILEFVGYNLAREGYQVLTASDGAQAVEAALTFRPHLILLDMMMPVMDGLQTCRALRARAETADTCIVFLSALGEEESQLSGFGAGADDYIPKPVKLNLLKSRVNAILRRIADTGDGDGSPQPTDPNGITLDRERHLLLLGDREISLPKKEFALFDLLYSSPERLFTREEIYSSIWGTDVVVGDRTIDVHIRRLRRKIGDSKIVTVKGLGYKYQK